LDKQVSASDSGKGMEPEIYIHDGNGQKFGHFVWREWIYPLCGIVGHPLVNEEFSKGIVEDPIIDNPNELPTNANCRNVLIGETK